MRPFFSVLVAALVLISCDDGDVLTVELDFDNTYMACGDLVLFKTKAAPGESLTLLLDGKNLEELLRAEPTTVDSIYYEVVNDNPSFEINGTTNRFNYRTYNTEPNPSALFCNEITPVNTGITNDYSSSSGLATFIIELTEDDNDGIPAILEDLNVNGNLEDDDTDGDGIPNYLDADDDGDNVYTSAENPNYSEELGLSAAQDTDGDGTPDYLDDDDDGDNVPTRNEESTSPDQNPTNDITNSAIGSDYLNPEIIEDVPATAFRVHSINQEFAVQLIISGIILPVLTQETLDFGFLDNALTSKTRTVTPAF